VLGLIRLLLNVYLTHVHATLNKYACQQCINQTNYNEQATICHVTMQCYDLTSNLKPSHEKAKIILKISELKVFAFRDSLSFSFN
jgi:hypothetical protein